MAKIYISISLSHLEIRNPFHLFDDSGPRTHSRLPANVCCIGRETFIGLYYVMCVWYLFIFYFFVLFYGTLGAEQII